MTKGKKLLTADVREMKYAGYGQHSQPVLRNGLLFADVYGKDQDECEDNVADVLQAVNSHSELVKALEAARALVARYIEKAEHGGPEREMYDAFKMLDFDMKAALTAAGKGGKG